MNCLSQIVHSKLTLLADMDGGRRTMDGLVLLADVAVEWRTIDGLVLLVVTVGWKTINDFVSLVDVDGGCRTINGLELLATVDETSSSI